MSQTIEPLKSALADNARFLRSWMENPRGVGAVSPSGPALARAMASYVDLSREGPVVELGPGTGPVTQALLERGVPASRLLLVEYETSFCDLLRQRFPGVEVVQGDAYSLKQTLGGKLEGPIAAVVSSLPLLNQPESDRLRLLDQAFEMMAPGGVLIQFTYGLFSPMPLKRHPGGSAFSSEVSRVWANIPPARVWRYSRRAG
ncbi:class I SAM-dependent methyltransferase [Methylosinus sp. Ce-a6]|uniref:class I SAM-dependent methyltransferase n=1 Tax=Methylosinus sp. Ce-a6 TaxID=2172005 RepID=UPI00135CD143|nr:methyltransferase domain-containing protein [Methylosinus sp. Ce-a6]